MLDGAARDFPIGLVAFVIASSVAAVASSLVPPGMHREQFASPPQ
jgi:hypothetical protein